MIYYIIGIRRSGLHAIANWLFPMMGEYIYLNNYELGKLQENELVVNGNFNVIIGLENKPVDEVLKYTNNGKRIWVLRDWQAVRISQYQKYSDANFTGDMIRDKLDESERLYSDYKDYLNKNELEYIIEYLRWNKNELYREKLAADLGFDFNDSNKEKIFGYGKSSFVK